MQDDKRNYVIVGSFVLAMVTVLILWIALLSGRTGATDDYFIVYDNVLGLKSGIEIMYEGFPVGLIEDISPIERDGRVQYRVDVSVEQDWPIPVDSRAEIRAPGLLSAFVIDLRSGRSETLLSPGAEIPGVAATNVMAALSTVVGEATKAIETGLKPILDSLAEGMPAIVGNVETFTAELNESVEQINSILGPQNVSRVASILDNLDKTSNDVARLVQEMETTRSNLDSVILKVDVLLEEDQGELHQAAADLQYTLEVVARRIDAIVSNLEETTQNINEFGRQVRDNPGVLVRGRAASSDREGD